MTESRYIAGRRRMLVDMHITDSDPSFLAAYDPGRMAELYERAELTSVMFYCNSHVGLCNWPCSEGKMHAGLGGRDVVGELLGHLRERGMGTCAYYSVVYDNWAFLEHPEWRLEPIARGDQGGAFQFAGSRYGLVCPNNPDYRAFTRRRMADLLGRYDFDCLFYDMTFWPRICGCGHCRARCREETGADIPEIVDWTDPAWCAFVAAREDWILDFVRTIVGYAKEVRPDLPVYVNFALAFYTWAFGFPLSAAREIDFCGGDLYGDRVEQLFASKLMTHLSTRRPPEFMTSRCINLKDHVRLKGHHEMELQAFAATALGSAFLFIDAIDPVGTVNEAVYDRIGSIYRRTAPYERFAGGEPVEDVAVYHSSESRMDPAENGTPVADVHATFRPPPHQAAAKGAVRMLQRAHIPFGVITRKQLGELDRWRVVILPEVVRMDDEEVEAVRSYVARGGRIYASRSTSILGTDGTAHPDLRLADVFGCHLDGKEEGPVVFVKPVDTELADLVAPQDYISQMPPMSGMSVSRNPVRVPRLRPGAGRTLATLSLPYGYPEAGTVLDEHWSSIHSAPPHTDTDHPVIVEHRTGDGVSVYSAIDLEATPSEVNERVFVGIVRRLLGREPSASARAHPAVWMNVFDHPDEDRMSVTLLNYQADLPAVPVRDVLVELDAGPGKRFTSLTRAPDGAPMGFEVTGGRLRTTLEELDVFEMLVAAYAAE